MSGPRVVQAMMSGMQQLDDLDRRIVAALQVNGRASWTDIAAAVDTSVTTVARRAQQLLSDGVVRIIALTKLQQGGDGDLFLVRLCCTAGRQLATAAALVDRPDVRFLAVLTGEHDLIVEILVPRGAGLHAVLVEQLQGIPWVRQSVAELVLHTYKIGQDWSRQLIGGADQLSHPHAPHLCDDSHLDELDTRIVALLHEDGRAGFQTLAKRLGVNESTVRRRCEALYRRGCVETVTLVPAAVLGYEAEVMLFVSVEPARLESVAALLAEHRGVRFVAAVLGQYSLVCEVIMPTTEDLYRFVTGTLGSIDGVRSWQANVEALTVKRGFVVVPWAGEALANARTDQA
ncbi:Lrp/AsnC family transcriptional regulator [Saccharopolyspora sp. K220]|uniref:Lrp/AsnC family transcriptional regulator n=1 Tax=Saccharopolyspora soli TaxID=2926618 RepID=UPI001F5622CF|nr:Lrp/AsnC family transcriptional regulator [Saccharopolyspora soli]MCI2418231.1 Lrp/AsnC family transcriptional regulator [Saccharopolyspora soli]